MDLAAQNVRVIAKPFVLAKDNYRIGA